MPAEGAAGSLHGRAALVTGGTAGIGLATARRLAACGAAVAVAARGAARGEAAAASLRRDGATAAFLGADVADPGACVTLPGRAADALGAPVTVLVNAAGGGATDVDLERTTPERLREILACNLESTVQVTRAALPGMLAAGGGNVVSVGGVNAVRGMAGAPAYAAAKAGVAAFTRCLATDHAAAGLVAVCVHPGAVLTERLRAWVALRRSRGEPVDDVERRAMDPDEVGEWVAFLCGPAGALVNGADIVLERR